jgi:protein-tyrosine-phosphatase
MKNLQPKPVKIHFICSGNLYRSRLAETYLKSLNIPNFTVSSSGLEADKHRPNNGPISWYALRIIVKSGIGGYMSLLSTQTQTSHIRENDIVILMHQDNYGQYQQQFPSDPDNFEIWDIPDLHHLGITHTSDIQDENYIIRLTEETFEKIKMRVDDLVKKLR